MAITILGLGPADASLLTRQAWDLLTGVSEVYLRTRRHPAVSGLPGHLTLHSFDDLYETLGDLPTVYTAIADRILALGRRPEGVLYAVPGHPLIGETSVQEILKGARDQGLPVRLVHGLSFVEPVLAELAASGADLSVDGLAALQLADATELAAAHHPGFDPGRPALVGQLYSQRLASDVKLTLMNAYPDDHPVTLVRSAGSAESAASTLPLYQLDRIGKLDHLTSLFVPQVGHFGGLPAFQQTVARLRAPDGCPWDREQTNQSLGPNLLEETYELLAAIDAGDSEKMCEELGDVLMQVVMHVQIATEGGAFRMGDVIGRIDAKLKRRHPHVFGDVRVRDTADVLRNWEAIKAAERASHGPALAQPSRLDGVPSALPALARAQSLGERAARAGFDWPDVGGVLTKLDEEVAELCASDGRDERARELGDLLFTLVNLARWLDLDAETALRAACERFVSRFSVMEQTAYQKGAELSDMTPAQQDALWEEAKTTS